MEDDVERVKLEPLRDLAKALVDTCEDADLLDLVNKLLANAKAKRCTE